MLDSSKFLDELIRIDEDQCCCFPEREYKSVIRHLRLSKYKGFANVTYRGLCKNYKEGVSMKNIKLLIETKVLYPKSKAMLLILYRGTASEKHPNIDVDQYMMIAKYAFDDTDTKKLTAKFNKLDRNKHNKITYEQLAKSLFDININDDEDPFIGEIEAKRYEECCCCRI